MITLKDLFEVTWTVTELIVTARDETGVFRHKFYFSPGAPETMPQGVRSDTEDGKTTYIWSRINEHGKPTRSGSEMGWGVNIKKIPKEILNAEIMHLSMSGQWTHIYRDGNRVNVDVVMHDLEIAAAKDNLEAKDNDKGAHTGVINMFDW